MKKAPKKILIIDDEKSALKVITKWVRVDGKVAVHANTGEIGFTKAIEEKPDLILLDIMLPDVGGVDLARRLYKDSRTKDIPIIFITAYMGLENDQGDEEIEIDGRFYRAFAKPIHARKMLSDIRKAINRSEQKRKEKSK